MFPSKQDTKELADEILTVEVFCQDKRNII